MLSKSFYKYYWTDMLAEKYANFNSFEFSEKLLVPIGSYELFKYKMLSVKMYIIHNYCVELYNKFIQRII